VEVQGYTNGCPGKKANAWQDTQWINIKQRGLFEHTEVMQDIGTQSRHVSDLPMIVDVSVIVLWCH